MSERLPSGYWNDERVFTTADGREVPAYADSEGLVILLLRGECGARPLATFAWAELRIGAGFSRDGEGFKLQGYNEAALFTAQERHALLSWLAASHGDNPLPLHERDRLSALAERPL